MKNSLRNIKLIPLICFIYSVFTLNMVLASTTAEQLKLGKIAHNNGPIEDSSLSTCHISSKEILAAAEATARAILQGICNPRKYYSNNNF